MKISKRNILTTNFVDAGNTYKKLAKTIKYEDGDRAWIKLDKLKQTWINSAWVLHDKLANDKK